MLTIDECVLIIVDVQGKLASVVHDSEKLFDNIERLIRVAQILGIPILWTEQAPEKIGPTVPKFQELLSSLKPIGKYTFSCWREQSFAKALESTHRSQVLVCGIETHVCIYQTAWDLSIHGYEVHLTEDAVSSRRESNKINAINRMRQEGIVITNVEMAICELLGTGKHPKFKEVMEHVKR